MKDALVTIAYLIGYILFLIAWFAVIALIYIAFTVGPLIVLAWATGKLFHLI